VPVALRKSFRYEQRTERGADETNEDDGGNESLIHQFMLCLPFGLSKDALRSAHAFGRVAHRRFSL
jgi:hypothetical protein